MKIDEVELLNQIYGSLQESVTEILKYLRQKNYTYKWGYYSGHFVKYQGEWLLEKFPIPVITVEGKCDIGVDLEHIFIECKKAREEALELDFKPFKDYKFEVYGSEDYLNDFYNENLKIEDIYDRIRASKETEIGVSLFLKRNEKVQVLMEVLSKI